MYNGSHLKKRKQYRYLRNRSYSLTVRSWKWMLRSRYLEALERVQLKNHAVVNKETTTKISDRLIDIPLHNIVPPARKKDRVKGTVRSLQLSWENSSSIVKVKTSEGGGLMAPKRHNGKKEHKENICLLGNSAQPYCKRASRKPFPCKFFILCRF